MPSLVEAFKLMNNRGLVASCLCYCEQCGQEKMLQAAYQCRAKHMNFSGFAHLGEWNEQSTIEGLRIPVRFGTVDGETLHYDDPDCLAIGEIVSECLNECGIQHEWDRVPGSPVLVQADETLTEIPMGDHHEPIELDEDHRGYRARKIPSEAYDAIEGNPIKLQNLAKMRDLGLLPPHLQGRQKRPRRGDRVKLGFLVEGAVAPSVPREVSDLVQTESMWVEVTSIRGTYPNNLFHGELQNKPVVIDPAKLRRGSPISFTQDNVYPVMKRTRIQTRR